MRVVRACRLLTESIPRSLRVSRAKGSTEVGGRACLWMGCLCACAKLVLWLVAHKFVY